MIGPINQLIEKLLLASLQRKRETIITEAVNDFVSGYPEATELQKGILKTKIIHEGTRVTPIVDRRLKATIISAQQTFWFMAICSVIMSIVGLFFPFFAFFTPLINVFIAWNSKWLTSSIDYEQRFIAAMESVIKSYVNTELQRNPLEIESSLTETVNVDAPSEPIEIVIDNEEVNENEEKPLVSPANYSIFYHPDVNPEAPETLSPHPQQL